MSIPSLTGAGNSFNHIVFANKREHDFAFSEDTESALKKYPDSAQDLVVRDLTSFFSKLSLGSKIIRRFERFGVDAEYDQEDALEILTSSFMSARSTYLNQDSLDNYSFPKLLVEEVNNSVDEAYVGDAVTEWSILNGIEGEIETLIEDAGKYYGIKFEIKEIVEQVMDACDKVAENFVKENDTSTGLGLLAQEGGLQVLASPHVSALDDGDNTLKIANFNQVGVGGLRPDAATLSLLKLGGLAPIDVINELREELSPSLMEEWSDAKKIFEQDLSFKGKKIDIQDVLDIVEHCGDQGGIPVIVTEISPDFFATVEAGDDIKIARAGLTMIPHNKNIDLPGVTVIDGPINIKFEPAQIIPSHSINLDFLKEASLRSGELNAHAKLIKPVMDLNQDDELTL